MDFHFNRSYRTKRRIPRFTPCGYCFERWATCWDHILPFSYSPSNKRENLMPSCRGCNAILSDAVFSTIEDKRKFIADRREKGKLTHEEKETIAREALRQLSKILHAKDEMAKILFNVVSVGELGPISPTARLVCVSRNKKHIWGVDKLGVFSIELQRRRT